MCFLCNSCAATPLSTSGAIFGAFSMPSARLVGHVWWQCSSGLIRIANAIVCGEGGLVGLRGVTAGDQFGPYVLRSGVGADAGCGRGLGRGPNNPAAPAGAAPPARRHRQRRCRHCRTTIHRPHRAAQALSRAHHRRSAGVPVASGWAHSRLRARLASPRRWRSRWPCTTSRPRSACARTGRETPRPAHLAPDTPERAR